MSTALGVATLIGFAACLMSFIWAMTGSNFFRGADANHYGIRAIKVLGLIFLIAHLITLIQRPVIDTTTNMIALIIYIAAFSVFWWAIRTNRARPFSAAFSDDLPQHLVTTGPYRYVRHPFYAVYVATWLAGVFATSNLLLLVSVVVMAAIYYVAARMEEWKFEQSTLAGEYEQYRRRTGMFIPNLIPLGLSRSAARTKRN